MTKENQMSQKFSDEFLNAFVDDQLAADEKGRAYLQINQDESLNRQVCELRKMHELVQLAYRDLPMPQQRSIERKRRRVGTRTGIAATLMLGLVLGTQIETPNSTPTPVATKSVPATPALVERAGAPIPVRVSGAAPLTAKPLSNDRTVYGTLANKVLIHIAEDDTIQVGQALDEIESLLKYYRASGQNARVEVVINGKGLELVRADTSIFAERIHKLQREFDNLTFAACQNSIDRLKREQGILVRLLPGVVVIDSGMAELMRRQNQGWTYIQV